MYIPCETLFGVPTDSHAKNKKVQHIQHHTLICSGSPSTSTSVTLDSNQILSESLKKKQGKKGGAMEIRYRRSNGARNNGRNNSGQSREQGSLGNDVLEEERNLSPRVLVQDSENSARKCDTTAQLSPILATLATMGS